MGRGVRIVVPVLAALALGLLMSAPAQAQGGPSGGQTTPSAGDNQYIDPLANPPARHHKHKPRPTGSSQHSSSSASSSASSQAPSQPATSSQSSPPSGGTVGTGATAATGTTATGATAGHSAAVHHRKKASSSHRAKAQTTLAGTSGVAPKTAAASLPAAINPPSHPGSSFPYVYLIVAVCAALGAALLGRQVLLRRAARRT